MRAPRLVLGRVGYEEIRALKDKAARSAAITALRKSVGATGEARVHAEAYFQLGLLLHTTPEDSKGEVYEANYEGAHRALQHAVRLAPRDDDIAIAESNVADALKSFRRAQRQYMDAQAQRRAAARDDDDDDDEYKTRLDDE